MQNGIVPATAGGSAGTNLVQRGYYVRVGAADPDENVIRSNNWNSDYHIPMHSNARGLTSCGNYSASDSGTIVFYYPNSSAGQGLAETIAPRVGGQSPGDYRYASGKNLYELRETNMPAAFIEAEFHDWQAGVDWLQSYDGGGSYSNWTWTVGWGVDTYLGYP